MKIVVLGAGTVGTWIADLLCKHRHSVTVVDVDPEHTKRINEELDVRALTGEAAHASVLFQADVLGADLCLAVTGDDEVNLVAASMAKGMGARRSIARVFAPVFRDLSTFDYQRHFRHRPDLESGAPVGHGAGPQYPPSGSADRREFRPGSDRGAGADRGRTRTGRSTNR
jgi:hypothetical protein